MFSSKVCNYKYIFKLTLIRSGTWPIYSKNNILYNKIINTKSVKFTLVVARECQNSYPSLLTFDSYINSSQNVRNFWHWLFHLLFFKIFWVPIFSHNMLVWSTMVNKKYFWDNFLEFVKNMSQNNTKMTVFGHL